MNPGEIVIQTFTDQADISPIERGVVRFTPRIHLGDGANVNGSKWSFCRTGPWGREPLSRDMISSADHGSA